MCVVAFGWLVVSRCVLTMDNQWKRRMIVVNGCPLCQGDAESVGHLLLSDKSLICLQESKRRPTD